MKTAAESSARRGWVAVALFLTALGAALVVDHEIDRWVVATRSAEVEWLAKTLSRFLAWHWLMLGALLAALVAWWRGRRDWVRVLCLMMVAASLAGLSADFLRGMIGRTRPTATAPQGWYGVRTEGRWLITEHAYNSFPSGHTTAATAFALPLFLWRRRLGLLAFPFVALVAGARVWASAHHLSDVLAGAFLGSVIALALWRWSAGGERFVSRIPPRRARE